MYPTVDKASLLEHLETQQKHVIQGLDQLNTRIEATIREWAATDGHCGPMPPGTRTSDSDPCQPDASTEFHSTGTQPDA
ncbi:MAG: hypothetical protein CMJ81_02375 [Planctomycetaceae bacterium]|nr:hypothetical protein [Planctomycetaceae bacterium]MBP61337.1 hypothetical protein [Planctomycetaceae bacterium]